MANKKKTKKPTKVKAKVKKSTSAKRKARKVENQAHPPLIQWGLNQVEKISKFMKFE